MQKQTKTLLEKHHELVQSDQRKVTSHVQREQGDWVLHTVMLEEQDVPFKFKRKKRYRSLVGARVNITYYPATEEVAGLAFEIMKVVRIRRA